MAVLYPPTPIPKKQNTPIIYIAGSIEGGIAEEWQSVVEHAFENKNVVLLNPRRKEWDNTWKQDIHNLQFREQVEWELTGLACADIILLYLSPGTQSPISLLEFGLYARSGKLLMCCPEGFSRKGNVDIVCVRYGVPQFPTLSEMIDAAQQTIFLKAT
ncbi:MAG TPA: nucleoside 2-deoxyribosyltransferase domain-containing protein [Patescibacteria group bacterium]|nr:nucleoside 2-deoxyribosyltransferase domain-containing protein [Patescibacteria group bacterium]